MRDKLTTFIIKNPPEHKNNCHDSCYIGEVIKPYRDCHDSYVDFEGYVVVFGEPDVGKSTFSDQIVGQNLSIVTDIPPTTRHWILGIVFSEEYQIDEVLEEANLKYKVKCLVRHEEVAKRLETSNYILQSDGQLVTRYPLGPGIDVGLTDASPSTSLTNVANSVEIDQHSVFCPADILLMTTQSICS
ncbi:hypothetical protein C5167_007524 [Papaver somniferum]|nr:hypothetical protein C5167_007524 [Papaver somniferum]